MSSEAELPEEDSEQDAADEEDSEIYHRSSLSDGELDAEEKGLSGFIGLRLDPIKILATAERLERRIKERFPGSGLSKVCGELRVLADRAHETSKRITKPEPGLRILSGLIIALLVAGFVAASWIAVRTGGASGAQFGWAELVQVGEAAVNDLLLLGAAIFFFVSLERRRKRERVFGALHDLRTLSHLVDVHQLTKNPDVFGFEEESTPSSPKRHMTPYQMGRYLDYCSEMLSLSGKIAALYSERFDDAEAVKAVNDYESFAIGLQRKIWQKMVILESRATGMLAFGSSRVGRRLLKERQKKRGKKNES